MLIKILPILLIISGFLSAQEQLPTCNIYHFNLTKHSNNYSIKSPKFLTQFNISGYNNQPYFFDDQLVYFTTDYYGGNQTDIASMDLFDYTLRRITYTKESEYSPIPIPASESFSCVRVELDQKTQSLSVYPRDGIGFAKRIVNNSNNIGYYGWINEDLVALFLIDEKLHSLAISEVISERRKIILDKIGRTLKVDNDEILFFVHKFIEDDWLIKSFNNKQNKIRLIGKTLDGVEDFELLADGKLLSGKGSKLYILDPESSSSWQELANLKTYGINNITRIVAYKSNLLVVNAK